MDCIDITVIGAGVIGLAVARTLSKSGRSLTVLERHASFGQETSSRNSEVIHAGIYNPAGSLKTELCIAGAPLLYDYCQANRIGHQRLGKLIVAVATEELAALEKLKQTAQSNGVSGLRWLSTQAAGKMEPDVSCQAALFSPNTGILDTHQLMKTLAAEAQAGGAMLVYNSEVTGIAKNKDGYQISLAHNDYQFESRVVVNCAGLAADRVAALAGLDLPDYRLHWCKGDYFRSTRPFPIQHLVYPVPTGQAHGLGIHLTKDLSGGTRFGPDTEYVTTPDYSVRAAKQQLFWESIRKYLPQIKLEDLSPDTSGIRPKLQGPLDGFRDFSIRHEADRGYPGLINLIGIESPGLTACLAIACRVQTLAEESLV